jgi:hypothetical protein
VRFSVARRLSPLTLRRCKIIGPYLASTSLPGPISMLCTWRSVRWLAGSKMRRLSTSSPKEVDAHRQRQVGRPDVHHAAAAGKCARLLDDLDGVIAGLHPGHRHLLQPQRAAHLDRARSASRSSRGGSVFCIKRAPLATTIGGGPLRACSAASAVSRRWRVALLQVMRS